MLQAVLLLILVAKLIVLNHTMATARTVALVQGNAIASRLVFLAEGTQRFATVTRDAHPRTADFEVLLPEAIAAGYLPPGMRATGPYGGTIRFIARRGRYDHVTIELRMPAPEDAAETLRAALASADRGGAQVSVQATEGGARFDMPTDASLREFIWLSGGVQGGQALGDDSVQ